jgi:hypothetical protein
MCMECQKVKTEHKHPKIFLQPLPIPKWKWDIITIYFITKFPRTTRKHDSIMVMMDKLTKAAQFIPVKMTHKATNIVDIYMKEIARIHSVPKEVVSDKHPQFTSNFWKELFKGFGTTLNFNTSYHP